MFFRRAKLQRDFTRFGRANAGAVFVEFSLALWPLLATLLFLYDMFANFWTLQQVDLAGASMIEKMRAGELDPRQYTRESFRTNLVCSAVTSVTCDRIVVNLSDVLTGPKLSSFDVSNGHWCPGGPLEGRLLQIAFPVPFLSRFWAGGLVDSNVHYVSSFALRNRPEAAMGAC